MSYSPDFLPSVSLLVAMKNEERFIISCLESLFNQDYPADKMQVLVMDGMSTDNSWPVTEEFIDGKSMFCLLRNPKGIQSAAWNLGIERSHGDILTIVSAHSVLSNDYVSKAIETLQRTGADLVGGTVRSISTSKIGEAIAIAMSTPFGVGGARFRYTDKEEETDSVFMGFCRRSVYEKIGGYDEELVRNQDDEFSYRLKMTGGRIICNPEIKSYYYTRSSFRSLWKQYFQYGFWKVRVLQKHSSQMRLRQFVPTAFILALVVSIILAITLPWGWISTVFVFGIYLFSTLFASVKVSAEKGWWCLPYLPVCFSTLHFSYGLGFIWGMVRHAGKWGK